MDLWQTSKLVKKLDRQREKAEIPLVKEAKELRKQNIQEWSRKGICMTQKGRKRKGEME